MVQYTQRRVHTEESIHRGEYAQKRVNKEEYTQKSVYMKEYTHVKRETRKSIHIKESIYKGKIQTRKRYLHKGKTTHIRKVHGKELNAKGGSNNEGYI